MSSLLTAIVLVLGGPAAFADNLPKVDDIVARMSTALQLTQEQIDRVKSIVEDDLAQRRHLWQSINSGGYRSSMTGQMDQLNDAEEQRLSEVLTSEQMQKWRVFNTSSR